MFQVNDVIIYGAQGVCKIIGTDEKIINGKKKLYFVLKLKDRSELMTYIFSRIEKNV